MQWLPWVLVAILAVYALIVTVLHFWANPLPWPDWGNTGLMFASAEQRWIYIQGLAIQGWIPDMHTPGGDIDRVIYFRQGLKLILDVATPEKLKKMGNPHGFVAGQHKEPQVLANALESFLRDEGLQPVVDHDPDKNLADGSLSAVAAPSALSYMFVARAHVIKLKGAKPYPKELKRSLRRHREKYLHP